MSNLTSKSQMYSRDCNAGKHFYEAIQLNIVTTGIYVLTGDGRVRIFGYIYKDYFNPMNPFENLLTEDSVLDNGALFRFIVKFQANTVYILVVTTLRANDTGSFAVHISGPNNISLNKISEYTYLVASLMRY